MLSGKLAARFLGNMIWKYLDEEFLPEGKEQLELAIIFNAASSFN